MPRSALARFVAKCRYDPATGCVVWVGGTSGSRDGDTRTGAFWYEGARWSARRWAAKFIHGLSIAGGNEVGAACGNPLCVQHVHLIGQVNGNTRQYYVLRRLGYEDAGEPDRRTQEELRQERVAELAAAGRAPDPPPSWLEPGG